MRHDSHDKKIAASTQAVVLQPFSQQSRTPSVAKEFQIGLYDTAEADLELFCNSWSAGIWGERLYHTTRASFPIYSLPAHTNTWP